MCLILFLTTVLPGVYMFLFIKYKYDTTNYCIDYDTVTMICSVWMVTWIRSKLFKRLFNTTTCNNIGTGMNSLLLYTWLVF